MTIGVLAFHGDFAEHIEVLLSLKVKAIEVRSLEDLAKVDRLIIPGGESTVMSEFLESTGVGRTIQKRVNEGTLPVYGTCAGAILLARKVRGKNSPKPLKLINIVIDRNAYGNQPQSFSAKVSVRGIKEPMQVAFIRAPKITKVGRKVEILAVHDGDPILVRQGKVLAGTFHPEVRAEKRIHEIFLRL